MQNIIHTIIIISFACLLSFSSNADTALVVKPHNSQSIKVGTLHFPPFSIKNADGSWSGISIELWREIADELNLTYQLEERSLKDLLTGIKKQELDAVVAAITVTESRESVMDFTHPLHSTGFAIATAANHKKKIWFSTLKQLFTWQFVQVVAMLFALLFIVGWIMWLLEHKHQPIKEDSHTIRHISEGFWWAAATMTTVGYGDKTPLTKFGRAFGVVWMFTALMIVASFIAAFSSILTVQKINTNIQGLKDLNHMRVATVPGSTSENFLLHNEIAIVSFANVKLGLKAVSSGKVDAMVYDAPLLQYFAKTDFYNKIEVSPVIFERQDYGFALTENSQLREPFNRILLRTVRSDKWEKTLDKYIGK